jgi:TPR repeat protein
MKLIRQLAVAVGVAVLCGAATADFKKGKQFYEVGDYKSALTELTAADAADSLDAQMLIGIIYLNSNNNKSINKNAKLADIWFKKSLGRVRQFAEAGDAPAQNHLGKLLYSGYGVNQNKAEAMVWLRRAAEKNFPDAFYELGLIKWAEAKDKNLAFEFMQKAASLGNSDSQYIIADSIRRGLLPGNINDAIVFYRQAAEQGAVGAQMDLVWLYEGNMGVQKNLPQAVYWLHKVFEEVGRSHYLYEARIDDLIYSKKDFVELPKSLNNVLNRFVYEEVYNYLIKKASASGKIDTFIEAFNDADPSGLVVKIREK